MKLFWQLLSRDKVLLSWLLVFILGLSLFSFLLPLSFSLFVDQVLPQGATQHLLLLSLCIASLVLLRIGLNWGQDYLFLLVRVRLESRLSACFIHSLCQENQRLKSLSLKACNKRLLQLLGQLQHTLPEVLYFAVFAVFVSGLVLATLLWIYPLFLYLTLGFLLLHALNHKWHFTFSERANRHINQSRQSVAALVEQSLQAKPLIDTMQCQSKLGSLMSKQNQQLQQGYFEREYSLNQQEFWQNLLKAWAFILLLVIGAKGIVAGQLTLGSLLLCLLLISFAYQPVYRLNKVSRAWSEIVTQFEELQQLYLSCTTGESGTHTENINGLQLRDMALGYKGRELFHNLNYTLNSGHFYWLKGDSGCGKSSLLRCLAGLHSDYQGQVLWNGKCASGYQRQGLYQQIEYVPQYSCFFPGTLLQNLTLFSPEPDMQRLEWALDYSCCDFVDLQQLATTDMDSQASTFSGGQSQRLMLARAIYQQSPVLLLDEVTSGLDGNTEQRLLAKLQELARCKLVILVSHRPATAEYAHIHLTLSQQGLQLSGVPS